MSLQILVLYANVSDFLSFYYLSVKGSFLIILFCSLRRKGNTRIFKAENDDLKLMQVK